MRRRGMTLLELIVVLAVLGIVLAVSGLAISTLTAPHESAAVVALKRARAEAIHFGKPRTAQDVRFLPDGRALGAHVDPLSGRPDAQ